MKTYDWIVIGGGITGASLSYELVKQGFSVLLLEQDAIPQGATRYSYGGLAFWSGTTALTRQLCQEGMQRYSVLSEELGMDIQFRELDLLLTIPADQEPQTVAARYAGFAIPPQLLSVVEACTLEPLMNPEAIAGALTVRHGHVSPQLMAKAYSQALQREGGELQIETVQEFLRQDQQIIGVRTQNHTWHAANTVVCAGGMSRTLLASVGMRVPVYFTHTEMIEIPSTGVQLNTLMMPAEVKRFQLEAQATTPEMQDRWEQPGQEIVPPILDAGAVQFLDGSLRVGQISRVLTDPHAVIDPEQSEAALRSQVGKFLPALEHLPGTWHHCLVAFSSDRLPVVGSIPELAGMHVFSGFSNPLVVIPALAQRFAKHLAGNPDPVIAQVSPTRLIATV
ncbi:MAG: FAD-binding oxidoreductase [Leptolyngbyaceae bacterium]|nr:FAD-binding oxidoreductase [Leptolyngbyaceae bacterium]